MQPLAWFSSLPDAIKWAFEGCGAIILASLLEWFRRRHRDGQAAITNNPSVVQAPVNNNNFAPTVNVAVPSPPPPAVSLRKREEEACDAIGVAVGDVANAGRNLHRFAMLPSDKMTESDFGPAHRWLVGSLAKWNEVRGKHIFHVGHKVADAADEGARFAGLVLMWGTDSRRGTDPVFDYRYSILGSDIADALGKMEFELRERLDFIRRSP